MGYDLHAAMHDYTRDPAVPPTPIDTAAVTTRVRHRRVVRTATTGLVSTAAATVLAASAYGLTTLPTVDPAPAAPATSSPTPVAPLPAPAQEPSPTATPLSPAPSATSPSLSPPAPPAIGAADVPVFASGARVAHFPSNALEADVVAFLTESLGVQPLLDDADYACPPGAVPGRILRWPGTGVGLRVRTTDEAGDAVDPYVAAWTLMEPSATLGLATDAGLTAGAARDDVIELYPDADFGEQDLGGSVEWWFRAADDRGDLLVVGSDDGPVHRIESGEGCGE